MSECLPVLMVTVLDIVVFVFMMIYTCIKTVSRFSSLFIPGKQINIKTQEPINHSNDVLLFQYFY